MQTGDFPGVRLDWINNTGVCNYFLSSCHLTVDLILKFFHLGLQVEHSLLLARIRDRSAIREDMHAPVTDAAFGDFKAF